MPDNDKLVMVHKTKECIQSLESVMANLSAHVYRYSESPNREEPDIRRDQNAGFFKQGLLSTKYVFKSGTFASKHGLSPDTFHELKLNQCFFPVRVATDPKRGQAWWMYGDRFYQGNHSYNDYEVKVVIDKVREIAKAFDDEVRQQKEAERGRTITKAAMDLIASETTEDIWDNIIESGRKGGIWDEIRETKQEPQDEAPSGPTSSALHRQPIPDGVKMFVWKRDGGRCVNCGSKENLEFDHIIPLSMGGSNTARNLQLLCETCNRSKGGNLS